MLAAAGGPNTATIARSVCFAAFGCLAIGLAAASASAAEPLANYFGDPFEQVTAAIDACPRPTGPLITESQMRTEAHARAERGTRCYQAGRCRLPNAYLYDQEIIPRVKHAILYDGRFADTSVWVEGQRRWVYLRGCVRTRQQRDALERLVRDIDDVEHVINELSVLPQRARR